MSRRIGVVLGLGVLLVSACSSTNPTPADSITQAQCEGHSGFVFVPGGEFIRGSDRAERDYGYEISAAAIAQTPADRAQAEQRLRDRRWFEFEAERQTQTLEAFCIQTHLVTQQDYAEFVAATGHRSPGISEADYQAQGFLVHPYEDVVPYVWSGGSFPADKATHPVVLVSHEDALAYAMWRGQQDGVTYRLPTALEWEKTARGTDGRYFPWGNDWQADATHWGQSVPFGTSAIARYPLSRSPYGAEDMAGNVFEFTSTLRERQGAPASVMKGCSWDDLPGFCRAAYEHTRPVESRHILFGFRLVLEPERAVSQSVF
ncbi:MAG: formylglycine-generating enzyme family protein [Leptolyngbya sp. SIO1D8]|nr:formylglycine-generating enzyme family protein [Leptolyngbya sp. SIO1D8]